MAKLLPCWCGATARQERNGIVVCSLISRHGYAYDAEEWNRRPPYDRRRAAPGVVPPVSEALDAFLDTVKIHGVKDRVNMTCGVKEWEHLQEAVGLAALREGGPK